MDDAEHEAQFKLGIATEQLDLYLARLNVALADQGEGLTPLQFVAVREAGIEIWNTAYEEGIKSPLGCLAAQLSGCAFARLVEVVAWRRPGAPKW